MVKYNIITELQGQIEDYNNLRTRVARVLFKLDLDFRRFGNYSKITDILIEEDGTMKVDCDNIVILEAKTSKSFSFPLDWIYLLDEQLDAVIEEYHEAERARREAETAAAMAVIKKLHEEQERKEYERLKAKYEGEASPAPYESISGGF